MCAHEDDLRAAGREYATNTCRYEETARGSAMKTDGLLKAIIGLDGGLLGCHILGPQTSDLVQRAFSGRFTRGGAEHSH